MKLWVSHGYVENGNFSYKKFLRVDVQFVGTSKDDKRLKAHWINCKKETISVKDILLTPINYIMSMIDVHGSEVYNVGVQRNKKTLPIHWHLASSNFI